MYFVHKLTVLNYLLLYLKAGVVTRMDAVFVSTWRRCSVEVGQRRSNGQQVDHPQLVTSTALTESEK